MRSVKRTPIKRTPVKWEAAYLIGPVYLTSGQEFEGDNFTKLYQFKRCSSFYAAHLALFGDFNAEPKD